MAVVGHVDKGEASGSARNEPAEPNQPYAKLVNHIPLVSLTARQAQSDSPRDGGKKLYPKRVLRGI